MTKRADSTAGTESDPTAQSSVRRFGRAVDVDRVPATAVPADYPAEIESDAALQVRVDVEDGDRSGGAVYYEWPPADDGPLERVLDLRDRWPDTVAELRGERIPVAVEDGYLLPTAPAEQAQGSPLGYYGIVGGFGTTLAVIAGLVVGVVPPTMAVATALLVLNVVVLPSATYLDGWYLRTRTDWNRDPVFWAALAGFVGLNVVSVGIYLWLRRSATPY